MSSLIQSYPAAPRVSPATYRYLDFPSSQNPFFNLNIESSLLSAHAKSNINRAIQTSWASSTIKRYSSAIRLFTKFCDAEQIPEHLRFPADEFVLCAFAASCIGKHGGNTSRSRLSALKAWHLVHNLDWKGSPRLRYILNGVRNSAPIDSRRPL